jgi:hypothetical protein
MQNHKWNGKERLRTPQSISFRKYDRQGERERERERSYRDKNQNQAGQHL